VRLPSSLGTAPDKKLPSNTRWAIGIESFKGHVSMNKDAAIAKVLEAVLLLTYPDEAIDQFLTESHP
jgi:hypothetical protein